jgi:hypothetical protein
MTAIDLKSNLHKIIDKIQNEQLLESLHEFLQIRIEMKDGAIWNSMSEKQKKEVLKSYKESENENNLLDKDELFKKD